jgi:peptide chain release factor 2
MSKLAAMNILNPPFLECPRLIQLTVSRSIFPRNQRWNASISIGPTISRSGSSNSGTLFDFEGKKSQIAVIDGQMGQSDFWSDRNREKAQEVVGRLKGLKSIVKPLEDLIRAADDLTVMIEMAGEDEGMAAEVPAEIARLEKALDDLETKSLLSGPLDPISALLTINARDGGTDAHDWAEMLLRMYLAWARDHDYDTEILDRQDNEEAGINSATVAVRGAMAYGYLKGEAGIHRLVRISPFNAEGKRQTSFAAVDVSPEVSDEIEIVIRDEDLEEKAIRSSGPGGQHVNKTSSAIQLRHIPTGILICCQAERSQHKNRSTAMKMLRARLARIEEEKREAVQAAKYTSMPKVGFGSQIRSYFLHPDQRVKDSRTGYYMGNFNAVLDGNIQGFLDAYLRYRAKGETQGSVKDDE